MYLNSYAFINRIAVFQEEYNNDIIYTNLQLWGFYEDLQRYTVGLNRNSVAAFNIYTPVTYLYYIIKRCPRWTFQLG